MERTHRERRTDKVINDMGFMMFEVRSIGKNLNSIVGETILK